MIVCKFFLLSYPLLFFIAWLGVPLILAYIRYSYLIKHTISTNTAGVINTFSGIIVFILSLAFFADFGNMGNYAYLYLPKNERWVHYGIFQYLLIGLCIGIISVTYDLCSAIHQEAKKRDEANNNM
jgi:hypothetical protein